MSKWMRVGLAVMVCGLTLGYGQTGEAGWLGGGGSRYRGTWQSQTNGHHGRLNVRMSQRDSQTYNARFSGTFLGVVPFAYSVPMTVTGHTSDGGVTLSGSRRLPVFGRFTTNAAMNGSGFSASYVSEKDQGTFLMQRR